MTRQYYALKPGKATYRQPRTAYLTVKTNTFGKFIEAAAISENGELYEFTSPAQVVGFLLDLPGSTWIITYNAAYISCLIPDAINEFEKIDGYGASSYITTFHNAGGKIFLIDLFSFFLSPLGDLADTEDNIISELTGIASLWGKYREIIRRSFGVHPSKAPGSTALKTWKTTIKNSYTVKGKKISRHSREACTFGALHWEGGHYKEAWYYDVNASYLAAMRAMRYPVRVTGFVDRKPPTKKWIALANISYRTQMKFSPLNVQVTETNRRVTYHPTEAENIRVRLTYIDYLLLRQYGDLTINEWIEGIYWNDDEEEDLFSE
ncbi:hypothetical protein L0Y49_04225, partial [bacterium]|nr:hypothetical protein [bacterium]